MEPWGQCSMRRGSPLNRVLINSTSPIGKISRKDARDAYREQMEGLLEGGVDLFILETFSNLEELELAIAACKEISQFPIIAQMTFTEENKSIAGNTPEE